MSGQAVNLGQGFHYETSVEMVNEVAHTIHRVVP